MRLTVDSCIEISSAISLRIKRRKMGNPFFEKRSLMTHYAFHYLVEGALPLVKAFNKPCGRTHFSLQYSFLLRKPCQYSFLPMRIAEVEASLLHSGGWQIHHHFYTQRHQGLHKLVSPPPKLDPGIGSRLLIISRYSRKSSISHFEFAKKGLIAFWPPRSSRWDWINSARTGSRS